MLVLLRCLLRQPYPYVDKARSVHVVRRRWAHRKLLLTLKLFKQWKTRTTTKAQPAAEIHNQTRWPRQPPYQESMPILQFLWDSPKRHSKAAPRQHELLMMIRVQVNGRLLVINRRNPSQQIWGHFSQELKDQHQRTWSRRTCRRRLILIQVKLLLRSGLS